MDDKTKDPKGKEPKGKNLKELADAVAAVPTFQPKSPKPITIREIGRFRIRHLQPEQRLQIKRRFEALGVKDYAGFSADGERLRWACRRLLQCSLCGLENTKLALSGDEEKEWRQIGLLTDKRLADVAKEIAEFNEIFG